MTAPANAMPDIADLVIDEPGWERLDLAALCENAFAAVLEHQALPGAFEIAVLACGDARIAELNGEFRARPLPTNVLSWPEEELASKIDGGAPIRPAPADGPFPVELGNIAIAFDTCMREAAEADKPVPDHVLHLLVHGALHLLGYDHVRDKDAALMEGIEVEILAKLGYPNPY